MEENEKPKIEKIVYSQIFIQILLAVAIMAYCLMLNLAYQRIGMQQITQVIKITSTVFLLIGLIILERAYKLDSGKRAITAIEILFLSFYSLSITHMLAKFKFEFELYILASSYVFAVYYVFKAIVIYTKGRRNYLKSLSDIKEIVQKDEPQKKEATKKKSKNKEVVQSEKKYDRLWKS